MTAARIQRAKFNPKRRIRGLLPDSIDIAARARYAGSSAHKSRPEKYGLQPAIAPRPDQTLCDGADICLESAQELLREGIEKGLVSVQERGGFPQNVWAVTKGGIPVEAQLENQAVGSYHGYPMLPTDPLYDEILKAWKADEQRL